MYYSDFILLFISGLAGGALNATIGGGWFIVFPSLIYYGRQPVSGNAITTATLWSGHLASMKIEQGRIPLDKNTPIYFCIISLVGGLAGACLLVIFSHQTFELIGPYLLLCSWLMFTFNNTIMSYFDSKEDKAFEYSHSKLISLFLLNVYGSYFGAGVGMMFTALLRYYGLNNDRQINGLKDMMVAVNNGIAVLIFICSGLIQWQFALVLITGSVIGGFCGAKISNNISMKVMKKVMIVTAALVTLYFLNIIDLDMIYKSK